MENSQRKRRWGVNRWLVLLFTVLGAIAARYYPPVLPHIQAAPEHVSFEPLFSNPVLGDFYLTNTMIASFIVYALLILMAFFVNRALRRGELVPGGFSGAIEALIEALYNLTETTAGKWARTIFPWFATIVLVVLLANWMELLPFVDSVGWLEHYSGVGHTIQQLAPGVATILKEETAAGQGYIVLPWLRVASTDLNFTLALALIAVVGTQVIGLTTQGPRYLYKFFAVRNLFNKPFLGVIDFAVGILELISELSRILSFSFRLFGNIFAGMVLLFLVGALIPVFLQSGVLVFEFGIGAIQAFVFGMLTLVFMSMATQGHGGDEHEDEH